MIFKSIWNILNDLIKSADTKLKERPFHLSGDQWDEDDRRRRMTEDNTRWMQDDWYNQTNSHNDHFSSWNSWS